MARRHQLLAFVPLAYTLSWWPWVWYRLDPGNVDAPILPFGPFVAAATMLAVLGGWSELRPWIGKILEWRVGLGWYGIALLVPPVLTLTAVGLNVALGATASPEFQVPDWPSLVLRFAFIFLWIGLGEEPAWRGFALPRLLSGRTALGASLILGVIHAVWHLPLYGVEYGATNIVPWLISVFCFSVIVTWMWVHTAGNLLLPMLMHASNNTIAFYWRMFDSNGSVQLWWIWTALWVLTATAVVISTGPQLGRR
jgi:membrane protease YdiL (CAAX protease family)